MKVTFLGTGAATSYPLPFCHCSNCRQAWALGGPSLRKRSSVLINQDLIVDLGPDVMAAAFSHDVSLWDLRYCLMTHPHSDHFDMNHLFTRHPEYAVVDMAPLHIYASRGALPRLVASSKIESYDADLPDPDYCKNVLSLRIHQVQALRPVDVGSYRVTAFRASHDPSVEPLLYAIRDGAKTVFYGADTSALSDETWQGFHDHNLRFDVVILDHTYGPASSRLNQPDHLDAPQFVQHVRRMRSEGLLTERVRIFATHISHEGNPVHPELTRLAAENRYEVAYDGLSVEMN
jgi:phosphoribosyl 1,2-cyclic phosphate phosphodiesterase